MLMVDETTTAAQWEAWGEEMGLHRPSVVQYVIWLGDSLRADFGTSRERRTSARAIALEYALASLRLLAGVLLAATLFSAAVVLAMIYLAERWPDLENVGRWAKFVVPAIPPFVPGVLLAHIFFPNSLLIPIDGNGFWSYALPSAALGVVIAYAVVRSFVAARSSATNGGDPMQNADGGASYRSVSLRFIAGRMLSKLLRSSRFYLPALFAAVIFTELTFGFRGLSSIVVRVTHIEDFPLASSALMMLTMAYVVALLLVDIARALREPLPRKESQEVSTAECSISASAHQVHTEEWPFLNRLPMVSFTVLGLIVVLAVMIPYLNLVFVGENIDRYWLYSTSLDAFWLHTMFLELRYAFLTVALALIAAALIGASAALVAKACGGLIDRSLVWLFEFLASFPILLLGLAGYLIWSPTLFGTFLIPSTPYYMLASIYPAGMIALIASGMFFHRVRTDARKSRRPVGMFSRRVIRGILAIVAASAGPVVLMSAVFSVSGVVGASGWGGPIGKWSYENFSVWWTLLAALVLILTILCLNFLGAWLRERLEDEPPEQENGSVEAHAVLSEPNGK